MNATSGYAELHCLSNFSFQRGASHPEELVARAAALGYSALAIARGLTPGGRLLCCDVSEQWTSVGRAHWEQAGVADLIDLRIAPAVETLRALPHTPHIDLAFIDADKVNPLYA